MPQLAVLRDYQPEGRPEVSEEAIGSGLRAVFALRERWGLTQEQLRRLLGQPSRQSLANWRKAPPRTLSHDVVMRISYLLGIWKALELLYRDPENADSWVRAKNRAFGGQSPLERMLGGDVTDLAEVRAYLDRARGGW